MAERISDDVAKHMLDALSLVACADNFEAYESAFPIVMAAINAAKAAGISPTFSFPDIVRLMSADETHVN